MKIVFKFCTDSPCIFEKGIERSLIIAKYIKSFFLLFSFSAITAKIEYLCSRRKSKTTESKNT